jgi:hypothetical protein
MAVRVLHTLSAAGTIMPQARFPRVVADCDLDDAHLSSVRVRPARRTALGSDAIPDRCFDPGFRCLYGPLNDEQLAGLGHGLMLLDQQLLGERVSILPGGSNEA